MAGAPASRRRAAACVCCLCLAAVYLSHMRAVEQWLHHRSRWWSSSLGAVSSADEQRLVFAEAFYEALSGRDPDEQNGTAAALAPLAAEIERERATLEEYGWAAQGLSMPAEEVAAEVEIGAPADEQREREGACAAAAQRPGVSLAGGGSQARSQHEGARDADECCRRCWDNRRRSSRYACKAWTFDGAARVCHLKTDASGEQPAPPTTVSGHIPTSTRQSCPSLAERDYARRAFRKAIDERTATARARGSEGGAPPWPFTDTVLVSAWGRPEFLLATLEYLLRADAVDEHSFVFLLDDEFDLRMLCVIDAFPRHRGKVVVRTPSHDWMYMRAWGNTYNTLEGYRYAQMAALGSHARKMDEPREGAAPTATRPCRKSPIIQPTAPHLRISTPELGSVWSLRSLMRIHSGESQRWSCGQGWCTWWRRTSSWLRTSSPFIGRCRAGRWRGWGRRSTRSTGRWCTLSWRTTSTCATDTLSASAQPAGCLSTLALDAPCL